MFGNVWLSTNWLHMFIFIQTLMDHEFWLLNSYIWTNGDLYYCCYRWILCFFFPKATSMPFNLSASAELHMSLHLPVTMQDVDDPWASICGQHCSSIECHEVAKEWTSEWFWTQSSSECNKHIWQLWRVNRKRDIIPYCHTSGWYGQKCVRGH